jgi:glycosyltransferase involved in cell wall biosynthesis
MKNSMAGRRCPLGDVMRIAVISPFIDKSHGTERCIAELIERIARDHHCEIHLYAHRVSDILIKPNREISSGGPNEAGIWWHKVPSIPGPHLLQYMWWFAANSLIRWWHVRTGRFVPDLLVSPGINAFDAEVIQVHMVFEEFYRRMKDELQFRKTRASGWPLLLHRRVYYSLIRFLEQRIYPRNDVQLAAVSGLVKHQLETYFHHSNVTCVRNGVNLDQFNTDIRLRRRDQARAELEVAEAFVFLLIGNDWRTKGLLVAIEALSKLKDLPVELIVVGRDSPAPFVNRIAQLDLQRKIRFLPPSPDVMQYYAAADAYLGPSIEDAYGLPVLEAMACGLPVITSVNAGVAEIVQNNVSGLLLRNPTDATQLESLLRKLLSDSRLREVLSSNAAETAKAQSWDSIAADFWELLDRGLSRKREISRN